MATNPFKPKTLQEAALERLAQANEEQADLGQGYDFSENAEPKPSLEQASKGSIRYQMPGGEWQDYAEDEPAPVGDTATLSAFGQEYKPLEKGSFSPAPIATQEGETSEQALERIRTESTVGKQMALEDAALEAQTRAFEQGTHPSLAPKYGYSDIPVKVTTTDEQGRPVDKWVPRSQAVGQEFVKPLPFAQQEKAKSFGRAKPVIDAIAQLSEKINIGNGLLPKILAPAEKAKAQMNLNHDLAEYNALVAGFTPLIARAVGHVGVLTQQDVDSVRSLFPSPGDDKELRDRKMARIQSILAAVEGISADPSLGGGMDEGVNVNPAPPQNSGKTPGGFNIRIKS